MTHHGSVPHLLNRRTLLLGTAALVAGCALDESSNRGASPSQVEQTARTPPPAPALYEAPAGDALPDFKRVAGRFAQALATYDLSAAAPVLAVPPAYLGRDEELIAAAGPLRLPASWSRAEVEFVQYGGLTPVSPQASSGVAMLVLRQVLQGQDGEATVVRRTLDLRLRREAGVWRVEALASAGGTAVERPAQLPATAQQVLDDDRIDLPDSARWDIYSGQISPDLLAVMLRLAQITPLRATVLKTGHPERVVDGRADAPVSAHSRGRAVDLHTLGGVTVADAPAAVVRSVVEAAGASAEVSQVGAPPGFDLDAGGRRWFTNLVHADHLHVAVRG